MRLTTKGRYGVRAIVNLAHEAQNRPISISKIAKHEGLSPEFLEQIFFKLKKAGVIRSIRGPKGGFVLDLKPADISVKQILDAVGEPLFPAPCTDCENAPTCQREKNCPVSPVWHKLYKLMDEFLSGITLKDIVDQNETDQFPGLETGQDFSI